MSRKWVFILGGELHKTAAMAAVLSSVRIIRRFRHLKCSNKKNWYGLNISRHSLGRLIRLYSPEASALWLMSVPGSHKITFWLLMEFGKCVRNRYSHLPKSFYPEAWMWFLKSGWAGTPLPILLRSMEMPLISLWSSWKSLIMLTSEL